MLHDIGQWTTLIGKRIIHRPQVTSTMDVARQEVQRGAAEGTVVVTDEQTAGKGRIKRQWFTPKGNIALTIILYPDVADLPYLIMIAALAVARSIKTATGVSAQIKWPNDVLIKGKKVCGILSESEVREGKVAFANIGIGINVVLDLTGYPDIAATATSLTSETGRAVSRVEIIRALLTEFDRLYLARADREMIFQEWRNNLVTLGKRVQVTSGGNVIYGVAEDVDKDGSLLLRQEDGTLVRVVAGDVTLRENRSKTE